MQNFGLIRGFSRHINGIIGLFIAYNKCSSESEISLGVGLEYLPQEKVEYVNLDKLKMEKEV